MATRLDQPVYNGLDLAMAIRERADVVTADRRFHAAVNQVVDLKGVVRLPEA